MFLEKQLHLQHALFAKHYRILIRPPHSSLIDQVLSSLSLPADQRVLIRPLARKQLVLLNEKDRSTWWLKSHYRIKWLSKNLKSVLVVSSKSNGAKTSMYLFVAPSIVPLPITYNSSSVSSP